MLLAFSSLLLENSVTHRGQTQCSKTVQAKVTNFEAFSVLFNLRHVDGCFFSDAQHYLQCTSSIFATQISDRLYDLLLTGSNSTRSTHLACSKRILRIFAFSLAGNPTAARSILALRQQRPLKARCSLSLAGRCPLLRLWSFHLHRKQLRHGISQW